MRADEYFEMLDTEYLSYQLEGLEPPEELIEKMEEWGLLEEYEELESPPSL